MVTIDLREQDCQSVTVEPLPLTLLLVEDDAADAKLLTLLLERSEQEWQIRHASTIREARATLENWRPDLIISDLGLPDASGSQAVERLIEDAPDVPLIVLTGSVHAKLVQAALEAGAQDYINKDQIRQDTLRRSIQFAFHRHEARSRLAKLTRTLAQADAEIEEYAAMVAHDLRAPLRTSRLLASATIDCIEDPTPEIAHYARLLDKKLGDLDDLVLSMLEYSGVRKQIGAVCTVYVLPLLEDALEWSHNAFEVRRRNPDAVVFDGEPHSASYESRIDVDDSGPLGAAELDRIAD